MSRARPTILEPRTRWFTDAKRSVVRALDAGHFTAEQIMQAHNLTADEIDEWRRKYREPRGGRAA